MSQTSCSITNKVSQETVTALNQHYLKLGLNHEELLIASLPKANKLSSNRRLKVLSFTLLVLFMSIAVRLGLVNFILSIRCIVPHNYFTWEATRPLSDCLFCSNVTSAIELHNVTREQFAPYAYSSKPIVIRQAFLHWPAMKKFDYWFFKDLYASIEDADAQCQFLHFKSDFISLKDIFAMSEARVKNCPGEKSWYVGWNNCHPTITKTMRQYYPKPHFLPEDAEIPHEEYVFMGYDDGASMHLDFINRLMWQAQLRGSKIWNLRPPSECQKICQPLNFLVHPGDAVLVDTRIWYHATTIPGGKFSLSIQSEYG
ncbi:uncharacterized protein [Euwallacea similis]|uniref:uncharacterized protein n=1 Tax=Euwallacea similis TaxID=1736056 RepID=UPI00344E6305